MHGVASTTMGLHGSVWRFTVPLVSGACLGVSWLCVAYSVPVPCACVGKQVEYIGIVFVSLLM